MSVLSHLELLHRGHDRKEVLHDIKFSPDGQLLAVASNDNFVSRSYSHPCSALYSSACMLYSSACMLYSNVFTLYDNVFSIYNTAFTLCSNGVCPCINDYIPYNCTMFS